MSTQPRLIRWLSLPLAVGAVVALGAACVPQEPSLFPTTTTSTTTSTTSTSTTTTTTSTTTTSTTTSTSTTTTTTTTLPALCTPGTYSATGRMPCTDAPIGSYVDTVGATEPIWCEEPWTTLSVASISAEDCNSIVFDPSSQA